jgi:uncharacterized protein
MNYSVADIYGMSIVMSLDPDLLAILCCPETKQAVSLADAGLIQKVNAALAKGHVRNKANKLLIGQIEGGLIREDLKILYPIRDRIPVMLIEEGIPMEQILPAC